MKVIILAGGLPSAISEEKIPKPMAEIGGRPILWHIMKQYAHYGFRDFIICTGFGGQMIKQYFMDYYIYQSDITVHLKENRVEIHRKQTEDWNVSVVDTGRNTSAIDRIKMVAKHVGEEPFFVSFGDCVSNIELDKMFLFHKEHGKLATMAVARPSGRNEMIPIGAEGVIDLTCNVNESNHAWVDACTMIYNPAVFTEEMGLMKSERGFYTGLARLNEVIAYKHYGFWSPMETKRDQSMLENMWQMHQAPWKVWEDEDECK